MCRVALCGLSRFRTACLFGQASEHVFWTHFCGGSEAFRGKAIDDGCASQIRFNVFQGFDLLDRVWRIEQAFQHRFAFLQGACSGQIALDAGSGELMNSSIQEEATKVMSNLEAVLEAAGYSVRDILKTSIFLSDMDLFNDVNAIYASYFESDFPARETVAVKGLPKGVNAEISVIAAKQ